jgi:hypothetical protein
VNLVETVTASLSRGDYLELQREFLQLKVQMSSDPKVVEVIEILVARFQAAEEAATAARNAEVDAVVKELTEKFNAHAAVADYDALFKRISQLQASSSPYGVARDMAAAQRVEDVRTFAAAWQNYLVQTQKGDTQQAANELNQLIQLSARFTAIPRSALLALQVAPGTTSDAALARQKEEKAKADQFAAKIAAEIDAAKVPADLDATMAEVGSASAGMFPGGQSYAMKAFLKRWQDYLAAVQAGHVLEYQKILQELASNSDQTVYPRSKILALMLVEAKANGTSGANGFLMDPDSLTLDNLRTFRAQLDALGDTTFLSAHGMASLKTAVVRMIYLMDQVKAGDLRSGALAMQANSMTAISSEQTGDYFPVLVRLYEQICVSSLPAYIDIPDDLKPLPTERLPVYVERVMKGAVAAKDWRLAFRVAQLRHEIGPQAGNPDMEAADLQGFRSMLTAMGKEEASLWTDAVAGYVDSINSNGPHLPVTEIGARLARIRKEHPDDYEKAKSQPDYASMMARFFEAQGIAPVGAGPQKLRRPQPSANRTYAPDPVLGTAPQASQQPTPSN